MKITIAMAQMQSVLGDVPANITKAVHFISDSALKGGHIVCLPELFATGYNLSILGDKIVTLSRTYENDIHKAISNAAASNKIWVIAPYGTIGSDGLLYNSAVLYGPDGNIHGQFNKAHAFLRERDYFAKGDCYPVFKTPIGNIGIIICYDVGFPETARALALSGADMIFVPSAWRKEDEHAWLLNIPSRALENQLFTIGVNRSGHEGSLHLFGKSLVCDPWGKILKIMQEDEDDVALCSIEINQIALCRKDGGYLADL